MAVGGIVIAQFVVPSKHERAGAVGSLDGLEPSLARAFDDGGEFEPKKKPEPGDWLAEHREVGQTFARYLRSRPNKPNAIPPRPRRRNRSARRNALTWSCEPSRNSAKANRWS